jgi:anti-sigma B factor antagonist
MSLHIEQRENSEGIVILDLKGPLTLGHGDLELRDRLRAASIRQGQYRVESQRGQPTLTAPDWGRWYSGSPSCARPVEGWRWSTSNRSHLELFLLTKLALAFEFFDDEQEAVNSFFPDRAVKPFDILNFIQHKGNSHSGLRARSAGSLVK